MTTKKSGHRPAGKHPSPSERQKEMDFIYLSEKEIHRWEEKDGSRRTSKNKKRALYISKGFWTTRLLILGRLLIIAIILS